MNRKERRAIAGAKGVILDPTGKAIIGKPVPEEAPPVVITIGYCYESGPKAIAGLWHQSIVKLYRDGPKIAGGVAFREVPSESGPHLVRARNQILRRFLDTDDHYLLMTDTDMVFDATDLDLLLEADAAIAGAHTLTAAPGLAPWATALVEGDEGEEPGTGDVNAKPLVPVTLPELPVAPRVEAYGEDGAEQYAADVGAHLQALAAPEFAPRPVVAVGCGFTLYRRDVVQAMGDAYEFPFENVGETGEDITFCIRAKDLGFETILVPQARVGHLKTGIL